MFFQYPGFLGEKSLFLGEKWAFLGEKVHSERDLSYGKSTEQRRAEDRTEEQRRAEHSREQQSRNKIENGK